MDQFLPIAPMGAIGSYSFGPIPPNCQQLGAVVWTISTHLLPGAIGSNSFGPIPPNCSHGSNWEQFVWTNSSKCSRGSNWEQFVWTISSQLLPQLGAIRLDQFLPIAPAAIGRNSFGPIPLNCSSGSNWKQFVWTNSTQLLPGSNWEQFIWTNSTQLLPREQLGAIRLDQFLPIAPAGAIGSNSFGPIPSNCSRGSNWEQFGGVWTNSTQLLPREQLGAIRLDQFLPIAPAGAIGSNTFGPIPPNCSRGSNWEQFVWTNSTQLLPREQIGAIRLDHFHQIAPAVAIGSNSFGPIPSNCSRGSNWEQFVWTNSSQLLPREQLGAIRLDHLVPIDPAGAIGSNSFGQIASNCSRGSNWEQFVWTNFSQLL